jgi:hypothetical protein
MNGVSITCFDVDTLTSTNIKTQKTKLKRRRRREEEEDEEVLCEKKRLVHCAMCISIRVSFMTLTVQVTSVDNHPVSIR